MLGMIDKLGEFVCFSELTPTDRDISTPTERWMSETQP